MSTELHEGFVENMEARDDEIPHEAPPATASTFTSGLESESESVDTSASDSTGTSSDGSGSDASESDTNPDSDSESEAITREYLDSLLEMAKANMRSKIQGKGKNRAIESEDVIRLDDGQGGDLEEDFPTREFPRLESSEMPQGYFDFEAKNGSRNGSIPILRDIEAEKLRNSSSTIPAPQPPPPELTKDRRKLTKKENKAQKYKTAGASWFDLPAPDPADLPQLHREVEALRLRNSLDPKRFYRKEIGEGRGIKGLPKHFAIGTIIPTSTPFGKASKDNLTRAERKRTIVDELVDDTEAKRYAKRKFLELQDARAAKGRGTFAKKFAARKPKW